MKTIKNYFEKFQYLKWHYQLLSILVTLILLVLFVKFLIWIAPIIGAILFILYVVTDGEIFSTMWTNYKQSKNPKPNPFFMTVYHWMTEQGVTELPVSTMQFTQGVEFPDITQGIYYIHIEKEISDELLADFEIKTRQAVRYMSDGITDCVISRSKREPFLAIKTRLLPANEMVSQKYQVEEDF